MGPADATVMLVGEGPGQNEDKRGVPFIGKSGQELDNYLKRFAGINRSACYVCNVVNCRTNEDDRDPTQQEVAICTSQYLVPTIQTVRSRFIVAVGRVATRWFLGDDVEMQKVHGFAYEWQDHGVAATVIPVYHPSFGLHDTGKMRFIQEDFAEVGRIVRGQVGVKKVDKVTTRYRVWGEK
jgi:DNA polymerase